MYYLTIITICKNNNNELQKTLSTLKNRSSNIQHIIIDGSNNFEIKNNLKINSYSCEYYKQENSGIYSAINMGLIHAKGNYINILNSGDFHDEGILDEIDFKSNYKLISISTRMLKKNILFKIWKPINKYRKSNLIDMPLAHQSLFIHKELYQDFGPYNLDYKYSSDYDFLKKIFMNDNLEYIAYKNLYTNFILGGASSTDQALKETLQINLKYHNNFHIKIRYFLHYFIRKLKIKLII